MEEIIKKNLKKVSDKWDNYFIYQDNGNFSLILEIIPKENDDYRGILFDIMKILTNISSTAIEFDTVELKTRNAISFLLDYDFTVFIYMD